MSDKKLDKFLDLKLWERAIRNGVVKQKNTELLQIVQSPIGRSIIANAIYKGDYHFAPPRTAYINKLTGEHITYEQSLTLPKVRELFACTRDMDNVVLTVICYVLNELYADRIHPRCRSYQKGVSVSKIINTELLPQLQAGLSGYKMDISKYFDKVNQETLDSLLKSIDDNSAIDKLLWECYHDNRVYIGKAKETSERYMGFRQGNPVATFLANIGLYELDEASTNYDIIYVRYSDDILVFGKDAEIFKKIIEQKLHTMGLELNPKKVEKISTDKPFTFLGCKINGDEVDISDESKERFKKEIRKRTKHNCANTQSRRQQQIAVNRINNYLREAFLDDGKSFGWEQYFYGLINTNKTIIELDNFVKDHLKAMYVGNWHHAEAERKTTNEQLQDMGYLSMNMLYKAYKQGLPVYRAQVLQSVAERSSNV